MTTKFSVLKIWLAFLLLGTLLVSCEYEIIEPVTVEVPDDVSFTNDIIPIFNNSCNMSGCHVTGHYKVDLTPANAYQDIIDKSLVDIVNPGSSTLYLKLVTAGGSHEGRSTVEDQALILKWIEEGAQDN